MLHAGYVPKLCLCVSSGPGVRPWFYKVLVPRGVAYRLCAPGQIPTAALPCEPLGAAIDLEDGNITSMVRVCGCLILRMEKDGAMVINQSKLGLILIGGSMDRMDSFIRQVKLSLAWSVCDCGCCRQ